MRVALVTGGSRGIGLACAEALAADGLAVAVAFRASEAAAEKAVASIAESGGRAEAFRLDVADESSVEAAFAAVEDALGPVTVLVNNAGTSRDGLAVKYPTAAFEDTLAANLTGAFLCARRALRSMLKARWGRIVNLSSAAAIRGNPGQAAYSASKAGLLGLTRSLAAEVGGRGITVNAVCPGLIETDMTAEMSDAAREATIAATPAGRPGTPAEVAAVVRFLASEEASFVNGAIVTVDGGLTG